MSQAEALVNTKASMPWLTLWLSGVFGLGLGMAMRLSIHGLSWFFALLVVISCIVGLAQQTLP